MKKKKHTVSTNKTDNIEIKTESIEEDQVVFEEKNPEEITLEERCRLLEEQKAEAENKYFRVLAEFENYRRRNEKERINWIKNATEKLTLRICDVLDDFERALEVKEDDAQFKQFYSGVKSIYSKLEKVLSAEGLEKIESLGKEFNPMYHEAISYIPSEEEADTIVSVIQNGYTMGNKVIRAAKVAVSAGNRVE